jgi:hypothetical protein
LNIEWVDNHMSCALTCTACFCQIKNILRGHSFYLQLHHHAIDVFIRDNSKHYHRTCRCLTASVSYLAVGCSSEWVVACASVSIKCLCRSMFGLLKVIHSVRASQSIRINGRSQEIKTHVLKVHPISLSAPMRSEMHKAYVSAIRVLIVLQALLSCNTVSTEGM